MPEFNIRTDSVDVEQIMRQIRARIKEKRGVDYTEQQIQELANVKLERFLDPKGVRSDLVEQFKRTRGVSPEPPNYGFEDTTLYETHRGIVRLIRRMLNPILKMFFNPNPIVHVLHLQGQINNINSQQFRVREELDALYYEVIHNLVLEVTRLGIESKTLKMRLESLSSRMDFDERRARALEGVVQYKADTGPTREPVSTRPPPPRVPDPSRYQPRPSEAAPARGRSEGPSYPSQAPPQQPDSIPSPAQPTTEVMSGGATSQPSTDGEAGAANGTARRRRRRRRGRRGGRGRVPGEGAAAIAGTPPSGESTAPVPHGPEGTPHAEDGAGHQPQREYYDSDADGPDSEAASRDEDGSEPSDGGPHRGSRDGDPEQ